MDWKRVKARPHDLDAELITQKQRTFEIKYCPFCGEQLLLTGEKKAVGVGTGRDAMAAAGRK